MRSFRHSMATNWSIVAARAQIEQVKLEELSFKGMKSTEDQSTTYALIQSFRKHPTLVVKHCFFHACNKSDHPQLRPEAAITLQFLGRLGNATSWNIRLCRAQSRPHPVHHVVLIKAPIETAICETESRPRPVHHAVLIKAPIKTATCETEQKCRTLMN